MAKILYFAALEDKLGSASEEVTLPRRHRRARCWRGCARGGRTGNAPWRKAPHKITLNRQFAGPDTKIDDTTEIAIVSARPG